MRKTGLVDKQSDMTVASKKSQVSFLLSSVPEYIQKVECDTSKQ